MKSFVRAALLAAAVSVLTVLPVPTAAPFPRMDAATVDGYHLTRAARSPCTATGSPRWRSVRS